MGKEKDKAKKQPFTSGKLHENALKAKKKKAAWGFHF